MSLEEETVAKLNSEFGGGSSNVDLDIIRGNLEQEFGGSQKIQSSENILQKAIKFSQRAGDALGPSMQDFAVGGGTGIGGGVPPEDAGQVLFQAAQAPVAGAPENIMANPTSFVMGGPSASQLRSGAEIPGNLLSMFTGKPEGVQAEAPFIRDIAQPQSTKGQVASGLAQVGGAAIPLGAPKAIPETIGKIASAPGKAVTKATKPLRGITKLGKKQQTVSKEIKGLKETSAEITKSQSREGRKLGFIQQQASKQQLGKKFEAANDKFGKDLARIKSTTKRSDIADAILEASDNVDDLDVQERLVKAADKILEGPIRGSKEVLSSTELQAELSKVLKVVGRDPRLRTVVNQKVLDKIEPTAEGLKGLKSRHAPIFKLAEESKSLTKGITKDIATGAASKPERVRALRREQRLGTNFIQKAAKLEAESSKKQAQIAKQIKGKEKELETLASAAKKIEQRRSNLQQAATKTTLGLGLAGGLGLLGARTFGDKE